MVDGTLQAVVDRSFPFDQAGEPTDYIQDRRNFGKVVLVPVTPTRPLRIANCELRIVAYRGRGDSRLKIED